MRAAIFRNGDIVVDTVPDPTPGAGQALVKSLCCGICGTDLHAAKFTQQFIDRSRRRRAGAGRWIRPATWCSATNSAARSSSTDPVPSSG